MIPSPRTLPLLLSIVAAACGGSRDQAAALSRADTTPAPRPAAKRPRIVFLGTSLTAGYGLPDQSEAYPALIQRRLDAAGLSFEAVNAGVSGATSADSRRSIDWIMSQPVAVLVIETGANDGLRGLDVGAMRANIQAIVDRAHAQAPPPRIVVAGMEAPPNYGAEYTRRFRAVFPELARANGAVLIPFLLQGVAGTDTLNQPDGMHPTAAGQRMVADNVWRILEPVLRNVS